MSPEIVILLIASLGVLLTALYFVICYAVFRFAFARRKKQGRGAPLYETPRLAPYLDRIRAAIEEANSRPYENVSISSHDGLSLAGRLYNVENARVTVLLFHGYRSFPEYDFGCFLPFYLEECGYRVLMVDERAHGESEGKYITFGALERHDCVAWAEYAAKRFGGKLVLDGMSMGAATVLLASAQPLPCEVVAVLADSAYSSGEEILRHVGKGMHLPVGWLMPGVHLFCRLLAHFDPREGDVPTALRKNTLPVLLLHGESDTFVPYEMGKKNAELLPSDAFVSVPDADHGMGYLVDPEKVTVAVSAFFARALNDAPRCSA